MTAEEWQIVWFTAWVSALSTLLILPLGLAAAWLLARRDWPGKAAADIDKRFVKRTGEPWFGHDSIFAYAHVMILKEAIERGKSADRRKVAEILRTIDITSGPATLFPDGRLAYDEKGRRKGAKICIAQYRNGKPVPVYPDSIATGEAFWPKTS